MKNDKKMRRARNMAAFIAAVMAALVFLPSIQAASAQDGSADVQVTTMYSSSYQQASSDSSLQVQSQYHIYRPGDTVRIEGSVSQDMREETGADSVMVKVTGAQGQVVADQQASVDSDDGRYSATVALPGDAEQGQYDVGSKIEVSASVLGLLSADVAANLESSAQFMVASPVSFEVESQEGEQFQVGIASNSDVSDVELDQEAKKVSFTVEGEDGTSGVAEITVPKAMLSGEMVVMIDGQALESGEAIVKSNTSADVTFEVNYHHSRHTLDVTGTRVVPEFPVSALVMAAAVASVVGLAAAAAARAGRPGGLLP
jgi:hypothetical protein